MATKVPDDATATTAPSGAGFVSDTPTSTVRLAGTFTSCAPAAWPFGPSNRSWTCAGTVPGFASESFHTPFGDVVPAGMTHAVAGVAPTVAPVSPCGPKVRRATATPVWDVTVSWIVEVWSVEISYVTACSDPRLSPVSC